MIQALKLKNFQVHRNLRIVFSKGITTIKGPTDSGKSAIMRALRWVCLNDFAGEAFIRNGASTAIVKLLVEGKKVIRRKGKGGNLYKIDDKPFKAFGQSVPEPIAKLLGVDEINFQGQFDSPFWFANSGGEVSRQLNRIIDLSIIDSTLSRSAAEVREAQNRVSMIQEDIEGYRKELEQLANQKIRIKEFKKIESLNEQVTEAETIGNRLEGLIARADVRKSNSLLQKAQQGEAVLSEFRNFLALTKRSENLARCLNEFAELQRVSSPPPDFTEIETNFERLNEVEKQTISLNTLVESLILYTERLVRAEENRNKYESSLHSEFKGQVCPTCNQEIK